MKTIHFTIALAFPLLSTFAADQATFRAQDVDTKVEIGYGLAIADVNGDKKPDILLADKKQIVWYEAPNWTRHVITENLTPEDNVCIAAQDIDGDGKAEVAVGAGWNPGDTVNSGALFYLIPPADRTQRWEPVKLHHEPTIHRIKWVKGADGKYGLVSIPLHGRGNKNGEGAPVKHEFYHVPKDVKSDWPRTVIDEDMHMTHNFHPRDFDDPNTLLIGGKEGIALYAPSGAKWERVHTFASTNIEGFVGAGEVRDFRTAYGGRLVVAIEPMHGSNVVVYTPRVPSVRKPEKTPSDGKAPMSKPSVTRTVLDSALVEGHALQCADFLGVGRDQLVVGWRGKLGAPAGTSSTGVKLFIPDKDGKNWTQQMIDDKGMACEDLAVADLNGDGKPDLIAAGRATHNLKIYWNETK
jgi:hypothetical protein